MKLNNKYFIKTHIREKKFKEIFKEFCLDSTASETSLRTSISRKTIDGIYMLIRKRILLLTLKNNKEKLSGEVEIDESYFGAKRIRGICTRFF